MKYKKLVLETELEDFEIRIARAGSRVVIRADRPSIAKMLERRFLGIFVEDAELKSDSPIGFNTSEDS